MRDLLLRNNTMVSSAYEKAINQFRVILEELETSNFLAFFDLVKAARVPSHQLDPDNIRTLMTAKFILGVNPDGTARMTDHTRNVIVSCVEGEGLTIQIVSPFAGE